MNTQTAEANTEFQESTSITFEWTLRGLKNLFDSTKGDTKSKVTKSARFGGGSWQILFYANAGTTKEGSSDTGGFVSLYLSCEPTTEEKEAALGDSGRWNREGIYKFSFELRNIGKTVVYNLKEAHNHSFSYKTANWGWAQFARRDAVYYQSTPVKAQDAFVIICTITSSPANPRPIPTLPRQPVPKVLLDTVGALLDDPLYSDVQFIIPRRHQDFRYARRIWASRRMLERAEYFETMFNSSFAETLEGTTATPKSASRGLTSPGGTDSGTIMHEFEDSDDEDDDVFDTSSISSEQDLPPTTSTNLEASSIYVVDSPTEHADRKRAEEAVCSTSSHSQMSPRSMTHRPLDSFHGSSKMTVVVRDIAYTTYRAMLYYLYTDSIVFAPLSSSFMGNNSGTARAASSSVVSLPSTPPEGSGQVPGAKRVAQQDSASTRSEWISDWMKNNPGRPAPCSAKAAYRVADRLDLGELKERAAQHIFKSLTVDNIALEVFSPFAAAFDEIRKVEIDFFLTHWQEIRASESMRDVWQQIRNGRHPGFEEVWPLIAQSLEFKPTGPTPHSPRVSDSSHPC